jgi:hypothetical protein
LATQLGLRQKQVYKWFWEIKQRKTEDVDSAYANEEAAQKCMIKEMTEDQKFLCFTSQSNCSKCTSPRSAYSSNLSSQRSPRGADYFRKHYKLEGIDKSTGSTLTPEQLMASVRLFNSTSNGQDELNGLVEVMDFDLDQVTQSIVQ